MKLKSNESMHYIHRVRVDESAIDANGHVNNLEYLKWMVEAAEAHAEVAGCNRATAADGAAWFVRSHHIDYLRPALAGDEIEVRTWVHDMRRAASMRRYEVARASDGTILAKGETDWVYIETATGRPRSIPSSVRDLFEVGNEEETS